MRAIIFFFIALVLWATALSAPPEARAGQSSPFVQFLAAKACQGQTVPYINGCNSYLHKRITQHKAPNQALEESSNLCNSWYGSDPVKNGLCIQGCQFLNGKE